MSSLSPVRRTQRGGLLSVAEPVGPLYVADYPELERRLPIVESVAFDGFARGSDGRVWAFDEVRHTMVVISFEREPELRVASMVDAFVTVSSWSERCFDGAPDGRLLVIQGAQEATGLATRVSRSWWAGWRSRA